jgi:hypothetical protein
MERVTQAWAAFVEFHSASPQVSLAPSHSWHEVVALARDVRG